MSISLYSNIPTFTGITNEELVGAGNYAITDMQVSMWHMLGTTAGEANFFGQLLSGNIAFATFGFLDADIANTFASTEFLFQRSFPDGLILPSANSINITINSFSGISSVVLMINISGTVLP
jgi:hypothetical protein